jgi:hypothetical protein
MIKLLVSSRKNHMPAWPLLSPFWLAQQQPPWLYCRFLVAVFSLATSTWTNLNFVLYISYQLLQHKTCFTSGLNSRSVFLCDFLLIVSISYFLFILKLSASSCKIKFTLTKIFHHKTKKYLFYWPPATNTPKTPYHCPSRKKRTSSAAIRRFRSNTQYRTKYSRMRPYRE